MKALINYLLISFLILGMSSCAVVGGIFKAGMVWGIFLVVGIVALIIFLISRGKNK